MAGKVIFEGNNWGNRYRVESMQYGDYRWELERLFQRKSSAIYHAEMLMYQRGVSQARVIDTKGGGE